MSFPVTSVGIAPADTPFLADRREHSRERKTLALLALSHTAIEHDLYLAMLRETEDGRIPDSIFSLQRLMTVCSHSYSTVRRAVSGLLAKMSIVQIEQSKISKSEAPPRSFLYCAHLPDEIFARRRAARQSPYPLELNSPCFNPALHLAAERVIQYSSLTRREAQIALCCIEGLTNAGIGEKLCVSEHTVKSHLRNVFTKLGVRRRAGLASRLLVKDGK
jgi:DNA-binding CsgD family transcriptional regulator